MAEYDYNQAFTSCIKEHNCVRKKVSYEKSKGVNVQEMRKKNFLFSYFSY
jgi:hypothetical protein